jgi:hypothetical protein
MKMPQFRLLLAQWSIALSLLATACTADTSTAPAASSKPVASAPALPEAPFPIYFESTTMTLKEKTFTIEVAKSDEQVERGLMYRDSMPADHGMIFLMDKEAKISFWMKNTRIPLDIVFLDKNGKVLEVQARKPFDETGRGPASPALYVIELNLGVAEKIGLKPGDTVEIPKKYQKN